MSKESIYGKNVEKVDFWSEMSKKVIFVQQIRKSWVLVKNLEKLIWGKKIEKCQKSRLLVKNDKMSIFGQKFRKMSKSQFLVTNFKNVDFFVKNDESRKVNITRPNVLIGKVTFRACCWSKQLFVVSKSQYDFLSNKL